MSLPYWLHPRRFRPLRQLAVRPRLGLERLEDRAVPAGYTWIGGAHVDGVATSGDPNSWTNPYNWLDDGTGSNNAGVPGPGDVASFTNSVHFALPNDPTNYSAPFTTSPTYDRVNGGNLDGFLIKADWTGTLTIAQSLGLGGSGSGNSIWNAGSILVLPGVTFTNNTLLELGNLSGSPHQLAGGGTLINANTISQSGVGVVSFGDGSGDGTHVVNNGLYELDGDGSIFSATIAASSATFVNTGTFRKSGGAGGGAASVIDRISFASSGANAKIEVQQGTLRNESFSSNLGAINVSTGASFDPGSNATYSGSYSGSGGGRFLISNGLKLSGDTVFDFAPGVLEWSGGNINLNGHTLTIASHSSLTVSQLDIAAHSLDGNGTLDNEGTITQTGAGQLRLTSDGTPYATTILNHGLYVLDGGSDLYTTSNNFGGGTFTNAGILRKTDTGGGAGISTLDAVAFSNTATGSVEVLRGTLRNNSVSADTAGSYSVAPGATFVLTTLYGSRGTHYKGQYNFSGGGTVQITDEGTTLGDIHLDGTTTFNAAAGMFQWKFGGIDSAGQSLVVAPGSFLTLNGASTDHALYGGGTLQNDGTIDQTGDGGRLHLGGGTTLLNDGLYNLQGDSDIYAIYFEGGGSFQNAGVLRKSGAGSGSSTIDGVAFTNAAAGTVEVLRGTLRNNSSSADTAGSYTVAQGATFVLTTAGGSGGTHYRGAFTASGGGAILLNGSLHLDGDTTFNFAPGMFRWAAGGIDLVGHRLTIAAGAGLTLANDSAVDLYGDGVLFNAGTIIQSGAGGLNMGGNGNATTLNNAGTYDITGDAGIYTVYFNGGATINNFGTFEKSAGTGASLVFSNSGGVGVFNNTGTMRVLSGTLDVNFVSQIVSEVFKLAGGTWEVSAATGGTATLTLNHGAPVTSNEATVLLSGAGATFTNFSGLSANSGRLEIREGLSFTAGSPIANVSGGSIVIGPQSSLIAPAISNNGSSAISNNGSSITVAAGGSLITSDGAGLITSDGAGVTNNGTITAPAISNNGSSFLNNGSLLLTSDGAGLIGHDGASFTNNGTVAAPALSNNGSAFANTVAGSITVAGILTNNGGTFTDAGHITAARVIGDEGSGFVIQPGGSLISNQAVGILGSWRNDGLVSAPTIGFSGTLQGTGTWNSILSHDGGTFTVGNSPGILTVNGGYSESATGTDRFYLNGLVPGVGGYSQLLVNGDVVLGATLSLFVGFDPPAGTQFTIVQVSGGSIAGTFAGLPDGASVTAGGTTFRIHYTGSSVVLTVPLPRTSPLLVGYPQFAVGSDTGGPPTVTEYNPDASVALTLTPFPGTTGGLRTAVGDYTGDGVPDIAVGTGPGAVAEVKILDGRSGAVLFDVFPFEAFTGGVFLAAGDLTGDGKADLVITPDLSGGPRVEIYRGGEFTEIANFYGIDDPGFRGGARAALGDTDGDGKADLVISAGFGGGPRISVYDGASLATGTRTHPVSDFYLFEETLRNGAYVAVGDVNGDGKADIIGGGGPGGGPRVFVISGQTLLSSGSTDAVKAPLANFFAGDVDNRGGIRVAAKDLDGDPRADIVVGSGTGAGSRLTGYLGKDFSGAAAPEDFGFDAIPSFVGGVFVG